jgi:hypothetical protein
VNPCCDAEPASYSSSEGNTLLGEDIWRNDNALGLCPLMDVTRVIFPDTDIDSGGCL